MQDPPWRRRCGAAAAPLPAIKKQRLDRALLLLEEAGAKQRQLAPSWQGLDKDDIKAVAVMLLQNHSLTSLDYHGNKPSQRCNKVCWARTLPPLPAGVYERPQLRWHVVVWLEAVPA